MKSCLKTIVVSGLMYGITQNCFGVSLQQLEESKKIIAGTPDRLELEYKLAFELSGDVSIKKLTNIIQKSLKKAISKNSLKFGAFVGSSYYIDDAFQPFAFKDTYIDTDNFDILKSKSSFRLRYRWNRFEYYLRSRALPFLKTFQPTRCEIQYKEGYSSIPNTNILKVQESRFEFRNESYPFNIKQDAPGAPWPYDDYIKYATQGFYKDYVVLPTYNAVKNLNDNYQIKNVEFKAAIQAVTQRNRLHLNVSHPWGWGPNPDQSFIITIDKTFFQSARDGLPNNNVKLLEIEIEPERNTTTQLRRDLKIKGNLYGLPEDSSELIRQTTQKAIDLIEEDLNIIVESIENRIIASLNAKRLNLDFKYSRMSKYLGHVQ